MNGALEATPDVRSIPLGAKRKRGRPKIPNMGRSPLSKDSVVIPPVALGVAKKLRMTWRLLLLMLSLWMMRLSLQ